MIIFCPKSFHTREEVFVLKAREFSSENEIFSFLRKRSLPKRACFGLCKNKTDLIFFRKSGFSAASLGTNIYVGDLPADLVFKNEKRIKLKKPELIIFIEINVENYKFFNLLSRREKQVLQNHFRRIQQHCLVTGEFMRLQAISLGKDDKLWEKVGTLHDVDYAYAYADMKRHGAISAKILKKYKVGKEIIFYVVNHNKRSICNEGLLGKSIFFSGRFLKRFVHALRLTRKPLKEIALPDLLSVYDKDPRRNEPLVRSELVSKPEDFKDFSKMMTESLKAIENFPLSMEDLLDLAKKAFINRSTFPSTRSHSTETLDF